MIVEALLDCGDAEGAAPKDLFTWMASRYPLQTNFRPSASQALQKAYKRGRLEKRAGGKYRLNPNWEGGASSKRSTRRPQTIAQSTYAMHHPPQPSSPFTNAPLQHNHNNQQHPPAPGQQAPYNGYPHHYPYSSHPGYHPPQPAAHNKAPAPTSSDNASAGKSADAKEDGDAWEAAQHILQAINFGGLTQTNGNAASSGTSAPQPTTGEDELAAVLSALASAAAASNAEPPRSTLTDDERASLQAQLALLAAQLTEIVDADEEDAPLTAAPPAQPVQPSQPAPAPAPMPTSSSAPAYAPPMQPLAQPQPHPPPIQFRQPSAPPPQPQPSPMKSVDQPPPPIAAFSGAHLVLDVNAFPEVFLPPSGPAPGLASGAQTEMDGEGEEESDEDEDMEDVVVPLHVPQGHDALRT
ncbi:hypothetical protein C8T65DRAFT_573906 [Cerioporus squamosus]|nr:hypothetical protein C8T65DRAFT_573906 [Cerioporus squamosus]